MLLKGKTAVISGAAGVRGIGFKTAQLFAEHGARVAILDLDAKAAESAACSIGPDHLGLACDVADHAACQSAIAAVVKAFDHIDILINNTGGPAAGMIFDATENEFEMAFAQHVICNHILAKHIVPGMKSKGYGRIINIISTSVRIPLENLGVSNTIRGAVASWSKSMSNELAQYGITVNNLLPGFIATTRLDAVAIHFSEKAHVTKEEMVARMQSSVPAKRFGEPKEIAAVAAFLASPAASYVNGVSIPVDGGRTGTI